MSQPDLTEEAVPLLNGGSRSASGSLGTQTSASGCKMHQSCFLADGSTKCRSGTTTVQKKLLIACALCFVFMIVEVIGGWIADSVAVLSDAAHMLSDVSSFLVALFASWAATQPSSQHYSFGYHRAEIMGALVSVLIIWLVTGALVFEAAQRIINPVPVNGKLMFIIAGTGVVFNMFIALVLGHAHHGHDHGHDHDHGHGHNHDHGHGHEHERKDRHTHSHNHSNRHSHSSRSTQHRPDSLLALGHEATLEVDQQQEAKHQHPHHHSHSHSHSHSHHTCTQIHTSPHSHTHSHSCNHTHPHTPDHTHTHSGSHDHEPCHQDHHTHCHDSCHSADGTDPTLDANNILPVHSTSPPHADHTVVELGEALQKPEEREGARDGEGEREVRQGGGSGEADRAAEWEAVMMLMGEEREQQAAEGPLQGGGSNTHQHGQHSHKHRHSHSHSHTHERCDGDGHQHSHSHGHGHGHRHGGRHRHKHGQQHQEREQTPNGGSHGHEHEHGHTHGGGHGHEHGHGHTHGNGHDHAHDHDHGHGHNHRHGHGHHHGHNHGHGHCHDNINLRGAVLHVIGDLLQSIGVAIAGLVIWLNEGDHRWYIIDPLCTFGFSILVLLTTRYILRDIFHVLMERSPLKINVALLNRKLHEVEGVSDVHDLHVWNLSMGLPILMAHVHIEVGADPENVLQQLNATCLEAGIQHTTIQICNPNANSIPPSSHSGLGSHSNSEIELTLCSE